MPPRLHRYEALGQLLPSLELKLVEYPNMGFKSTATSFYKGLIFVRGPAVPTGYHASNELNSGTFLSDGWVKTDKLGQWDAKKKQFRIVGRLGLLDFRPLGDYVPLEKLEEVYAKSPLVEACCIVFLRRKVRPVAIIRKTFHENISCA